VVQGADRIDMSGNRTIALLGDGPIALMFLQLAHLRGVGRVILIGRHPRRMDVARKLGADAVIDSTRSDPHTDVRALTDGLGADTVIECVGRPEAWQEAMQLSRRGGEVLVFGGCQRDSTVALQTELIHYEEIDLKGAFHYTPAAVSRAWNLICGGHLNLASLITHRMPLDDLAHAFKLLKRREAVKVAIVP
jgi:L-iditol 2-dehydrogenase